MENPGPGLIARVTAISRAKRTVTVKWTARRSYWNGRPDATQQKTLRIPFDEVFCVDGYEPGTMRKFFDDPRTRAEYLKWAPFLMAAEDFAAGKLSEGQVERGDNEVKVGRSSASSATRWRARQSSTASFTSSTTWPRSSAISRSASQSSRCGSTLSSRRRTPMPATSTRWTCCTRSQTRSSFRIEYRQSC